MVRNICSFVPTVVTAAFYVSSAMAQVPATIAATDGTRVATFQAEGAQIYECKIGSDGNFNWVFREPIATLLLNDKTVGRHYAGPTWEDMDGNAVTGKAVADAPGTTPNDIALLKLDVEIKIDTFNFTRYGLLHGQVLSVSS
jgi:Protein of unknown function (DUF3455)